MTGVEKRKKGLGYEYYNTISTDITLNQSEIVVGFDFGRYGGKAELKGIEYAFACDFVEANEYELEYFENVPIKISRYVSESKSLKFTGTPIICYATGFYYTNDTPTGTTDFTEPTYAIHIDKIEVPVNFSMFCRIVDNNVDIYNLNSMTWDEVENIVDFGTFIVDFIKSIFVFIAHLFIDMGVYFK